MKLSSSPVIAGAVGLLVGGGAIALADRIGPLQDRARIEATIRSYILEHPEILTEARDRLAAREAAKLVQTYRSQIETPFAGAWAGNPKADVVVTMFTDYSCGYCRKSLPDIDRLLASDPNIRLVWREIPILGPGSEKAARAALLAARQGRYLDFHRRMFLDGPPDDATIAAAARASGVRPGPDEGISDELNRNLQLAGALGISGTPSFIVGGQLLPGAVGYQALVDAIAEARKAKG